MSSPHAPDAAALPPPRLEEVSDGVFAYLQLHGQWGLNNCGLLLGSESVTAIDTCFTERRSRAFYEATRSVSAHPVRTLINTHHHGDHTHGNFLFSPEAVIIGHEQCREEVIAAGLGTTALWPDVEWGDLQVTPPEVTFQERLDLWVDGLKVELLYLGPAHTTNDIVVWLPERGLVFAGDLIFKGGTPFMLMGSITGSLKALQAIRALGPETIVPGHGPVCGPEAISEVESYVRFVQETAERGFRAGLSELQTARQADLGPFADLLDSERLVGNLHRAYSELRGEPFGTPLPLPAVFAEMVAFNGGVVPRCLA